MFDSNKSDPIATRTVRRKSRRHSKKLEADICIVGAGISGISAALEAARLDRKSVV